MTITHDMHFGEAGAAPAERPQLRLGRGATAVLALAALAVAVPPFREPLLGLSIAGGVWLGVLTLVLRWGPEAVHDS